MTQPNKDPAECALNQMGRIVVPVAPPAQQAHLQARSAAAVDRMLERLATRRSPVRARMGAVFAAAALALLALGGAWLSRRESVAGLDAPHVVGLRGYVAVVRGARAPVPATNGLVLGAGDELSTAAGAGARLILADQATVEVGTKTRVRVVGSPSANGEHEIIELALGEVSLQVPKLKAGSTLSVRTPDALVTVRGTRFTVGVARADERSVVTSVSVLEGRVEVESQGRTRFLTRRERWSSGDEAASHSEPVPVAPSTPDPPAFVDAPHAPAAHASAKEGVNTGEPPSSRRTAGGSGGASSDTPRSPGSTSTLSEENRLYESALRAAQSGDFSGALARLDGLLQQYPRSPLVQNARVEHFRVLLQAGAESAAVREARRYLSEYPSGFARAEARQIALRGLRDGG
jgi:hypothetical protein